MGYPDGADDRFRHSLGLVPERMERGVAKSLCSDGRFPGCDHRFIFYDRDQWFDVETEEDGANGSRAMGRVREDED